MRKILICLALLSYLVFGITKVFGTTLKTSAQQTFLLILTPYKTQAELNTVVEDSFRVLAYLEEEKGSQSIILSVITKPQLQNLLRANLKPKILDQDPELDRYKLLYHQEPNQGKKLSTQGKIFILTPYHTLLKLSPGKSFVREGNGQEFFYIPFSGSTIPLPQPRKTVTTTSSSTFAPTSSPPVSEPIIKPLLFIIIFFLSGLGLFFFLRTKGILSARNHQLVYFSVLFLAYILLFLLIRPDTGADISIPPNAVF